VQVEFWFFAQGKDGAGVFRRTAFVPYLTAGFLISFTDGDESWEVRHVHYTVSTGRTACCLGEDVDPREPWQAMKARYLGQGWTLKNELRRRTSPSFRHPRWLSECRGEG